MAPWINSDQDEQGSSPVATIAAPHGSTGKLSFKPNPEKRGTTAWRGKRKLILERLRQPHTIQMLLDLFPSYSRAQQYMQNLVRKGKTMVIGHVSFHEDEKRRPRNVYCRRSIPQKLLPHELTKTLVTLPFIKAGARVEVGFDLPFKADFLMTLNGKKYYGEIDMDSESSAQLKRVLGKYKNCEDFVLFATVSEQREQEATQLATGVEHCMFFSVIGEVLRDPFGRVWSDTTHAVISLEEPVWKPMGQAEG